MNVPTRFPQSEATSPDAVQHEEATTCGEGVRKRSSRAKRVVKYAALPVALLISAVIVIVASQAAFTAQTNNPGNSWSTGEMRLEDDKNGVAMFDEKNILPGAKGKKNIQLTYRGSAEAVVKMYTGGGENTDSALAKALKIKITLPGGVAVFEGTMTELSAYGDYQNGLSSWTAKPPSFLNTYYFEWELPSDAPEEASGQSVKINFVWEARSKA